MDTIEAQIKLVQRIAKADYDWAVECVSELHRCSVPVTEQSVKEYIEYFEYDGCA